MSAEPTAEQVAAIAKGLSPARIRNLHALPSKTGSWATIAEMRSAGATGSGMDLLHVMDDGKRLVDRRWTRWGSEPGQRSGEGYEYAILPLGLAVRAHIIGASDHAD